MTRDGLGSYYTLSTVNRWTFYLPYSEGERVGERLSGYRDSWPAGEPDAPPLFVTFEDESGCTIRVNVNHIEAFCETTEAGRVIDAEQNERRKAAAPKKWDDDA